MKFFFGLEDREGIKEDMIHEAVPFATIAGLRSAGKV